VNITIMSTSWLESVGVNGSIAGLTGPRRLDGGAVTLTASKQLGATAGYGFITDHRVEKLMRDTNVMHPAEDTSRVQRLVIARRRLLPSEPTPGSLAA
jgi:alkylation response protein AidB-like acyl-CoA dehydrogenase